MKIFELNIKKLGVLLLPSLLRKAKMAAWIRALFAPLDTLHGNFLNRRKTAIYQLGHNGQICYLRKVLNDEFDPDQRRITFEDAPKQNASYVFTQVEEQDVYLDEDIYLHTTGELADTGLNFIVRIPLKCKPNDLNIRALLDFYKLASKRYIIYYE